MSEAAEYRRYAQICVENAEIAPPAGDRTAWLILGRRWLQLASEAEGPAASDPRPRGMTIDTREVDMKTCPDCNGDGVTEKGTNDEMRCPTCGGSGFVPDDNDDKNNEEVIKT
jgi:hypothetical protein